MGATNPTDGTLWISGDDSGGSTRTVQFGSTTDTSTLLVDDNGPAYTWTFQKPFGVTKKFRDAPSITNNLKMLMEINVSGAWITSASLLLLEQMSTGRADNQLTVELYVNVTGGSETEFYLDGATSSTVDGTAIRTANKAKFTGPIQASYFDSSLAKWKVSFGIAEENG